MKVTNFIALHDLDKNQRSSPHSVEYKGATFYRIQKKESPKFCSIAKSTTSGYRQKMIRTGKK